MARRAERAGVKALGVGVHVYIGWCRPDRRSPNVPVCSTGIIETGPFPPGPVPWFLKTDLDPTTLPYTKEPSWIVRVDGRAFYCVESLLTPIDDDDTKAEPREQEREIEKEHA